MIGSSFFILFLSFICSTAVVSMLLGGLEE
ncbi:Uncharacterised protein [Proteus vulgaris]|uniref:Uncharacterized protein n=1 Tax=Proteus vulgaris TaxID=585 RepID=A0A379FBN1_PROVU|nr:putative membrane protein [Proteus vulgaris]SUC17007.1 Uncharacterised protein [Proteus vulgaris]VTP73113.1 Uncharacterised protein [Proteus vulgaris]